MTGPRRHEQELDPEAVSLVRRLDCANYGACLDRADRKRWPGFRCGEGCYSPIDEAQRARDFGGLLFVGLVHLGRLCNTRALRVAAIPDDGA